MVGGLELITQYLERRKKHQKTLKFLKKVLDKELISWYHSQARSREARKGKTGAGRRTLKTIQRRNAQ